MSQAGFLPASRSALLSVKLGRLREALREMGAVVVGFSGGADSAFLAWVANDTLCKRAALAVTAVSASLAPSELADCRALAAEWDLNHHEVGTHELSRASYVANGADRCWHCKDELMRALLPLASASSFFASFLGRDAAVVLGVNVDDLGDYRPGQEAASARGARFPLVEAGFSKSDVREASKMLGLRTWDKPAAACLASRLPYGTAVTLGRLATVAGAEEALRRLGFRALRVRHYGDLARVELPLADLGRALELREQLVEAVRAAGYRYVTLDLEGFRSGNLNGSLASRGRVGNSHPEAGAAPQAAMGRDR